MTTHASLWAAAAVVAVTATAVATAASGPFGSADARRETWERHAASVAARGMEPLERDRLRFIQGRVFDASSGYVPEARVWLVDATRIPADGPYDADAVVPADAIEAVMQADDGGAFIFRGYRPGPKRLYAAAPDGRRGLYRLPGAAEAAPCRSCRVEIGRDESGVPDAEPGVRVVSAVAWPADAGPDPASHAFRDPSRLLRRDDGTSFGALATRVADGSLRNLGDRGSDEATVRFAALPAPADGDIEVMLCGTTVPATDRRLAAHVRDGVVEVHGLCEMPARLVVRTGGACAAVDFAASADAPAAVLVPDVPVRILLPPIGDVAERSWWIASQVRVIDESMPGPAGWLAPVRRLEPECGALTAPRSEWLAAGAVLEVREGLHPVVHRIVTAAEGLQFASPDPGQGTIEVHTVWPYQRITAVDDRGGRSVVRAGPDRKASIRGVSAGDACVLWLEDDPHGGTWYAPQGARPSAAQTSKVWFGIPDEQADWSTRGGVFGFVDPAPGPKEATVFLSQLNNPYSIRTATPSADGFYVFPRVAPWTRYHVVVIPAERTEEGIPVQGAKSIAVTQPTPRGTLLRVDVAMGRAAIAVGTALGNGEWRLDARVEGAEDAWLPRWAWSGAGPRKITNLGAGEHRVVRVPRAGSGTRSETVATFRLGAGECASLDAILAAGKTPATLPQEPR